MFGWMFRKTKGNAAEFRRRLMLAQMLLQKPQPPPTAGLARSCEAAGPVVPQVQLREILPGAEDEANLPPPASNREEVDDAEFEMAGAVEKTRQGQQVGEDVFARLQFQRYVVKGARGSWAITETGKALVERYKLVTEEGTMGAGILCQDGRTTAQRDEV